MVSLLAVSACAREPSPPSADAALVEDGAVGTDASAGDTSTIFDASEPDAAEGDAGTADATPDAGALAAADYCETTATAFCAFYLRCGRVSAADQPSCERYFAAACGSYYEPRYAALEAAGLLALDAAGVETCRAHLASVSCDDQIRDLDGPCAAMWRGTSPAGSACGLDVESFVCAPGARCVLGLDLCGTCVVEAADGAPCGSGVATCAATSECTDGLCTARARIGERCDDRSCVLGGRCTNGTCTAPAIVGVDAACDRDRRCAYGASCVGGRCVAGGMIGDACAPSSPCAVGRCAGGTCAPLLAAGERCTSSLECADGTCTMGQCDPLPGACFP
ncbi:hypothetical protein L6R52_03585 [Myxococcota bacterium]|nr:hypothetical protein [Myxococcota bacterium]